LTAPPTSRNCAGPPCRAWPAPVRTGCRCGSPAPSFVDAFELKKLSKDSAPNAIQKAIGEIAFASTFFRRYWGNGSDAGALLNEAFDTLKISSAGIATVDLGELQEIEILRRPSEPSIPDRHEVARSSILNQEIPA
jgi:hypothetical protein